jgi:CDP-4-dehydro-6-deoxyglucose reductase
MPKIEYETQIHEVVPGETVLECLERNGHNVPSSCRSGVCQTCLTKALLGSPPAASQVGLREQQKNQGYFLSCLCRPEEDLVLRSVEGDRVPATITSMAPLSPTVVRLRLKLAAALEYQAGQFFTLIRPDGLARSYSAASVPGTDNELEMHVAIMREGRMSQWLHTEARVGDQVQLLGPNGTCCYAPGTSEQPLFLLGTGTGLAPLYGILRDALSQGHLGPIHLFHGSVRQEGLYLHDVLRLLEREWPQFEYHPCVMEGPAAEDVFVGMVDEFAMREIPSLKGWKVYLCGNPTLVKQLQRKCFLAGASLKEIFADAFLAAAAPSATTPVPPVETAPASEAKF